MEPPEELFAERFLDLDGVENSVHVQVYRPAPDHKHTDTFICRWTVTGLPREGKQHATGVDPMQALVLCLQMVGVWLYTRPEYKEGRLKWLGSAKLGFPLADSVRDLEPPE